jgi:hypothetical protein|tara:strand:- start:703 stop:948 length:246 start_codon:yes stop_codon:yes gene_type:complete
MIYNAVYFDEENQKVRWTQTAPEGFKFNYEYVGKMTRIEFDLLVEVLWELYEDDKIKFSDFIRHFGELRTFCDQLKQLTNE